MGKHPTEQHFWDTKLSTPLLPFWLTYLHDTNPMAQDVQNKKIQ